MPWAWVSLLIVAAAEPTAGVEEASTSAATQRWQTSVQVGAGMVEEDPAAVIRPRLSFESDAVRLSLGLPVWLRLADWSPPGQGFPAVDQISSLTDWQSPETYAAILEDLSLSLAGGRLRLAAGGIKEERLGFGALVDDFYGSLDPLQRRTGARLDLDLNTVRVELLADSVVAPHLLAAEVILTPLAWAGIDEDKRLRISGGFALDPDAPRAEGRGAVGGGELGLGFVLWQSEHVALETYLTGAVLSTPGIGGHLGLRLEVAGQPGRPDSNALTADVEWVVASAGYLPDYFDVAYQAERLAVPSRGDQPKGALRLRDGYGLRGRVEARFGGVRFGVAAHSMLGSFGPDPQGAALGGVGDGYRGELSASAYLELRYDAWSVAAMVVKRDMAEPRDLVEARPGTFASLEAAVRFWDGFFAFAALHHGWRNDESGTRQNVTDWMGGLGYALGGSI